VTSIDGITVARAEDDRNRSGRRAIADTGCDPFRDEDPAMPLLASMPAFVADVQSASDWLPTAFIVAGTATLGVLAGLFIRGRTGSAGSRRDDAAFTERAHLIQRQLDEARNQALELAEIAEDWKRRLNGRIAKVEELIARSRQPATPVKHPSRGPTSPAARRPESSVIEPKPAQNLHPTIRSIYALADAGRSPVQIAQQLNEQIGKIELILALRSA
jgi:hypothetical protein